MDCTTFNKENINYNEGRINNVSSNSFVDV